MKNDSAIEIYHDPEHGVQVEVRLEQDTVWLDQYQMATLFATDRTSIGRHIRNIYRASELSEEATCAIFAQVQSEGKRKVKRNIKTYNLDLIISVGYRVNSKRGTQFRIWANQILKDYLLKGYAVNERRLQQKTGQLEELKKVVELQSKVLANYNLRGSEAEGLVKVIAEYARALDMLDDYDHQRLNLPDKGSKETHRISYKEATKAIRKLGEQTGFRGLFGREKDDSFKGSLENIYQTFGGEDLYPTLEEKAAHLLYFVTKNHSFTDGNKRIAAFLLVWFLERNQMLFDKAGRKYLSDDALVALTLMVAESNPDEKDMIIKLTVNLISPEDKTENASI